MVIQNPDKNGHGEVMIKGRHVAMGYLNNEKETAKLFNDKGYIYTGDIGYLDKEGFLHITGRSKDIIITKGGENIPYLNIEGNIKKAGEDVISNAMLIGDGKKYLTCVVTLKTEIDDEGVPTTTLAPSVRKKFEGMGAKVKTLEEAGKHPIVQAYLKKVVGEANSHATSNAQKVQYVKVLPEEFSIQNGLLTNTMKLKRSLVLKHYADLIASMYQVKK